MWKKYTVHKSLIVKYTLEIKEIWLILRQDRIKLFHLSKHRRESELFSFRKNKKYHQTHNLNERNEELENAVFRSRVFVCCGIAVLMVIILFCNLYYLQIISFKDYQTRSNENRIKVMPVVPPRGIIYDRNHVVLAENSPVYHLVMYPNRQINTEKTIRSLSELLELGLSEKEIKRFINLWMMSSKVFFCSSHIFCDFVTASIK